MQVKCARFGAPGMPGVVPVLEGAEGYDDGTVSSLPAAAEAAAKPTSHRRGRGTALSGRLAYTWTTSRAGAGVLQPHLQRHRAILVELGPDVLVVPAGVAEPVPESVARLPALAVVPPIADEQAFVVGEDPVGGGGGEALLGCRPGDRTQPRRAAGARHRSLDESAGPEPPPMPPRRPCRPRTPAPGLASPTVASRSRADWRRRRRAQVNGMWVYRPGKREQPSTDGERPRNRSPARRRQPAVGEQQEDKPDKRKRDNPCRVAQPGHPHSSRQRAGSRDQRAHRVLRRALPHRDAQGQRKEPPADPHAPTSSSHHRSDRRESRHDHKLGTDRLWPMKHCTVEDQQDHTGQRKHHRGAPQQQRQRPGSSRTIRGLVFHVSSVSPGHRERKPTWPGGHDRLQYAK